MPHADPLSSPLRLLMALAAALLAALVALAASGAIAAWRGDRAAPRGSAVVAGSLPYTPRQLVIDAPGATADSLAAELDSSARIGLREGAVTSAGSSGTWLVRLPQGLSVTAAAARVRSLPGIRYAVPDYIAHLAGYWVPDDPGRSGTAGGWRAVQWNFLAKAGVDAPGAWANLRAHGRGGAKGIVVAVLDTGVAFESWGQFAQSPDFKGTKFVHPCDLVASRLSPTGACTDPHPLDRVGHGTIVAGMIAEATNNRIGVTGLAYKASIMPVRVLNAAGDGQAATIAAGIRYAVRRHARVINLSMEFVLGTTAAQIPEVISAISYAYAHGVVVVAAAGNDAAGQGSYRAQLAYPARDHDVISVGATTKDVCLAAYSNVGPGLDVVAPGGGDDSASAQADSASCHATRNLPNVRQMSFTDRKDPRVFRLAADYGTSMAAPEVSAAAAMVIASGLLGSRPTPAAVLQQLEYSARPMPGAVPSDAYGYGLLDIANATSQVYVQPGVTVTNAGDRAPATRLASS